ncbi:hypothetical protein ACLB2K_039573 [Fragaria x ananassa]
MSHEYLKMDMQGFKRHLVRYRVGHLYPTKYNKARDACKVTLQDRFVRDHGMGAKVFELLLQVDVDGNLKPEQMIKRVYVFSDMEFDQATGKGRGQFEAYWVELLSGFSKNTLKLFLNNGGQIRPDLVMKKVVSGKQYQNLVAC